MKPTGRIAPFHTHEPLADEHGITVSIFEKWFQVFSDIVNEYFVAVRRKAIAGVRTGQPRGLFQNTRLTTSERDDIEPADLNGGIMIFNITTSKLQAYDGTVWVDLH